MAHSKKVYFVITSRYGTARYPENVLKVLAKSKPRAERVARRLRPRDSVERVLTRGELRRLDSIWHAEMWGRRPDGEDGPEDCENRPD